MRYCAAAAMSHSSKWQSRMGLAAALLVSSASGAASPSTSQQVAAASALIGRVVGPARAAAFKLSLEPVPPSGADSFSVAAGPCCNITGTNGVALASGFNWYLKYVARREVAYPLSGEPMLNISKHSSSTALMPHINMDDTNRNLKVGH